MAGKRKADKEMQSVETTPELVQGAYRKMEERIQVVRAKLESTKPSDSPSLRSIDFGLISTSCARHGSCTSAQV